MSCSDFYTFREAPDSKFDIGLEDTKHVRDFYGFLLVSQVETVDSVYKLEKEV
jgi:hypothetical protein